MTATQICALISIALGVALTYWVGYRGGLNDGRVKGESQGKQTNDSLIRELQSELRYQQADCCHLMKANEQLQAAQVFGEIERQTLQAAAEELRIAADTFRAMSARKHSQQALDLREKILDMITLLQPPARLSRAA